MVISDSNKYYNSELKGKNRIGCDNTEFYVCETQKVSANERGYQ